ncbi:sulfite exporter TauE/SafE family protein [Herbaspirillum chlorophenolicum]|uniref:sulfite exporter TauE/SafE family protein n=1 Tax=Herbaspirillum chlorophenolicum TaxID=211589 RepID=UPI00067B2827|nr:sulfite exporter TauE/SafE family protein [Herbaspirillum chlorophenolicum]
MNLFPVFLVGLMGSVHCVAMCGGIVGALSSAAPRRAPTARLPEYAPAASLGTARVISIKAIPAAGELARVLCYNAGRLASYAIAGALAGGIASGLLRGADVLGWLVPLQRAAYIAANLILVLLGLYLTQWWSALVRIEHLGQALWARLQPLAMRLVPVDTPAKALLLGSLWGWLPCGMVYSVLLTAMLAGDASSGALTMLVFGIGTLPVLVAAGLSGERLRALAAHPSWRRGAGFVVLSFGVLGLLRVAGIGGFGIAQGWLDVLCVTPHGGVR